LGERGTGAYLAHDRLACQRTGDLAVVMAAHAVSHEPQPQLAIAVVAVLVELPPQADVGQVSEFDHGLAAVAVAAPGSVATSTESSRQGGHCTSDANDDPGAGPGSSSSCVSGGEGGIRTPEAL